VLNDVSPDAPMAFDTVRDLQGEPLAWASGSAWAIPKGSPDPEAACRMARVMTETDSWMAAAEERAALRKKDGGLFTGILTRYLALAANDQRLPQDARTTAARLVTGTATALWAGRRPIAAGEPLARHGQAGRPVFSSEPKRAAGDTYPPGAAVELSTQLQAWMALEAAASLEPAAKATGN